MATYATRLKKLRLCLTAGLALVLCTGSTQGQVDGEASTPLGEDGQPLSAEEAGTRQGLLTRLLKNGRQAVVDGHLYDVPADLAITDANGAVRSPRYLEPGMYIRYRYETRRQGDTEQRVLGRVMVERHEPESLEH